MGDIYLDPATGDIDFSTKEPTLITDVATAVRQRLHIRLNTFEGEWFYDSSVGVPYFQGILGQQFSQSIIDNTLRRTIIETEDVIELTEYSSSFDRMSRTYNLSFTVTTSTGDLVDVTT